MIVAITYGIYLIFTISFTFWVGRSLSKNGRVFILEAFDNNEEMADSVSQLLLVGFYLINFGIVCLSLSAGSHPGNYIKAIEYLATKIGFVLIVLGGMHYFNMRNISKMGSKAREKKEGV